MFFCFGIERPFFIFLTGLSVSRAGLVLMKSYCNNGTCGLFKNLNLIENFVCEPRRKGLGSFFQSSQVICRLKPATEHCDETDGCLKPWQQLFVWGCLSLGVCVLSALGLIVFACSKVYISCRKVGNRTNNRGWTSFFLFTLKDATDCIKNTRNVMSVLKQFWSILL